MNIDLIIKKTIRYFSCAVKYSAALAAAPFVRKRDKYRDLWLISERGVDARDNGYYLFRYIVSHHPEINITYAISDESPDRNAVSSIGRVTGYGSFEHFLCLVTSRVKISTHIMGYTPYIDFFVRVDKMGLVRGRKIFLQHGIIKDNLTYLYNSNVNIDLFVCSAKPEYDYVKSSFGYREGVVRLLGLCRFDALYKIENRSKKILLMPTWRYNLRKADRKQFLESGYYNVYNNLLKSVHLNAVLERYGYELLFYPHMELQKFVSCFEGGDRVRIVSFEEEKVQSLLINTDILITDFSSVFFDYAYMEKPMIFYQFDEGAFRSQHYGEGYFNYKRDGFGKVVYDETELINELDSILSGGCEMDNTYRERVNRFFTLRDTNNSERNYAAIENLLRGAI